MVQDAAYTTQRHEAIKGLLEAKGHEKNNVT